MATRKETKILVVEPHKTAYVKVYPDGFKYDDMTKLVDGYIEAVYPFADKVALVGNEESKILGMEPNRALRDENGRIYDILCGTFFICGLSRDDFIGLNDKLLLKYAAKYATPEVFLRIGDEIVALPEI